MWLFQLIQTKLSDAQFALIAKLLEQIMEFLKKMDARLVESFDNIQREMSEQTTVIESAKTALDGLRTELTAAREELAAALATHGMTEEEIQDLLARNKSIEMGIDERTNSLGQAMIKNTSAEGAEGAPVTE